MNLINREVIRDIIIIICISLFLLTLINFVFVYFSPALIKIIPSRIVGSISPCYRTFYHQNNELLDKANFVFGDSFSEGAGDEFLNSDPKYGIFNKLNNNDSRELIFGRGGYGNISTVLDFKNCYPLISTFTSFKAQKINRYKVTLIFYEGNDLNNNLVERDRKFNILKFKLRFFLPVFEYPYKEARGFVRYIKKKLKGLKKISRIIDYPISTSGIEIGRYPQSAATELSIKEIDTSLNILFSSLEDIKAALPDADSYLILYLPSVASSYSFEGKIKVQSYKNKEFFQTTGELNSDRSKYIYEIIKRKIKKNGWIICNTTPAILNITKKGIAVHGPIDWKHFNKSGYSSIAETYQQCINSL